ncbi:MAG: AAA family ATPase [Anaerolineaceae bacterium]|nr:AAA family ATPase [Anaerolineaceae bacterium]
MIKSLKIFNFQSHKDSQLEFASGVNVIVGASDCGKTAIIRALRWLIFNKPSGDSFRSTWGGDTRVEMQIGTDIISRFKSKEIPNGYSHNTKVLEAFKTGVPEPVQNILNMDETNIQNQLDSPFLISSTPGEVASYFNKVAHLDQIDNGIRNIQSAIRQTTAEIQADENRVAELTEAFKAYEYIDLVEIDLEELEKMDSDSGKLRNKSTALEALIQGLTEIDIKISEVEYVVHFEEEVDAILQLKEKYVKGNEKYIELEALRSRLVTVNSELEYLNTVIQLEPEVEHIITEQNKAKDIAEKMSLFKTLIRDLTNTYTYLTELEHTIAGLELEFHDKMPDRCPLCDTVLTKTK